MENDKGTYIGIVLAALAALGLLLTLLLLPSPEPGYSALYFEASDDLPESIIVGRQYTFSFGMENEEGQSREYTYEVYLQTTGDELIKTGTFALEDGEKESIPISFTVAEPFKAGQIQVLADGKEIHFTIKAVS